MHRILNKIRDLSELVAFKHTIFSASFILISMIVSSTKTNGSWFFGFEILFLCSLTLISARNFAMGFNRLLDRDIDRNNNRTKNRPSVDGRLNAFIIAIFCIVNGIIFIITSYFINSLAFILSFPFMFIMASYSFFKRFSSSAHIILGISLSLAPIAGDIAVSGNIHLWSIMIAFGVMFWVAGFDILYSLQDIEYDKKYKLHSIPSHFGIEKSIYISRVFHILSVIFWYLFIYFGNLRTLAIIGLIASAIILIYEHILVAQNKENIPKAFFQTNGYLGFIFLFFVFLDSIFGL